MKFPLLNISEQTWTEEDLLDYILFDEFIFTDDPVIFDSYLKGKSFCDSNGRVFKVKGKKLPTAWWRKLFRFLPNVYKITLIFKKTGEKISVEELRQYMLEKVNGLPKNESSSHWLKDLKRAKTYEEMISGDILS